METSLQLHKPESLSAERCSKFKSIVYISCRNFVLCQRNCHIESSAVPKNIMRENLHLLWTGLNIWDYSKHSELSLICVTNSYLFKIYKKIHMLYCLGNISFEALQTKNFISVFFTHLPFFKLFEKLPLLQITLGLLYALNEKLSTFRESCMNNCLVCTSTSILPKFNEFGLC